MAWGPHAHPTWIKSLRDDSTKNSFTKAFLMLQLDLMGMWQKTDTWGGKKRESGMVSRRGNQARGFAEMSTDHQQLTEIVSTDQCQKWSSSQTDMAHHLNISPTAGEKKNNKDVTEYFLKILMGWNEAIKEQTLATLETVQWSHRTTAMGKPALLTS